MRRLVCISGGCFYRIGNGEYDAEKVMNSVIKKCSKLDIDGFELLIADARQLLRFKLNKTSVKILKNLEFNTIHAPFISQRMGFHFLNIRLTKRVLGKIYHLYDKMDAVNINIHPQQIRHFDIFNKDYNHSIESMELKHNWQVKDYRRVLRRLKDFKVVIDTTHANEKGELKTLIRNFKKNLIYFHLSANYLSHLHLPLHVLKEEYLKPFEAIKKTKVPIVLENITGAKSMDEYKKEVDFVRKWLN